MSFYLHNFGEQFQIVFSYSRSDLGTYNKRNKETIMYACIENIGTRDHQD